MTTETLTPPSGNHRHQRLIGRYDSGVAGPTLIVVCGLHGNEPAGVQAAERVMARLQADRPSIRGRIVAMVGNREALALNRRYLERDLNRAWTPEILRGLRAQDPSRDHDEDREQREILEILTAEMECATEPVVTVDLHTCSGRTLPFAVMSDTLRNRRIAFRLRVPVFLGLEESVPGTLLEYMTEQGHVGMVVESGQHEDPKSVDIHEAVIWRAIEASGALERDGIPDRTLWHDRLREASRGLPRVVELLWRHDVREEDHFRMEPGFEGFDVVGKGQLLATDVHGEIRAHDDSRILMPLYQEQGSDGFFLVRPVNRTWIRVSALLRHLKLARGLVFLPGVKRHPIKPRTLLVDARIARFYTVEIFHLFGFRQRGREGHHLIFARRRPG